MKDFSLPYIVAKQLLEGYYKAMIAQYWAMAFLIANDLLEMALKLEVVAHAD